MTAAEVAQWMLAEVQGKGSLYQDDAGSYIEKNFGPEFVKISDETGNILVAKPVLDAFKKISADTVVWERGERLWRLRSPTDAPGRQQD